MSYRGKTTNRDIDWSSFAVFFLCWNFAPDNLKSISTVDISSATVFCAGALILGQRKWNFYNFLIVRCYLFTLQPRHTNLNHFSFPGLIFPPSSSYFCFSKEWKTVRRKNHSPTNRHFRGNARTSQAGAIFIFDTFPPSPHPLSTRCIFPFSLVGGEEESPSIIYHRNDGGNWKYTHPFRLCHYQIYTHYK